MDWGWCQYDEGVVIVGRSLAGNHPISVTNSQSSLKPSLSIFVEYLSPFRKKLQHYFLNCNNNQLPGVMGDVASQGAAAAQSVPSLQFIKTANNTHVKLKWEKTILKSTFLVQLLCQGSMLFVFNITTLEPPMSKQFCTSVILQSTQQYPSLCAQCPLDKLFCTPLHHCVPLFYVLSALLILLPMCAHHPPHVNLCVAISTTPLTASSSICKPLVRCLV